MPDTLIASHPNGEGLENRFLLESTLSSTIMGLSGSGQATLYAGPDGTLSETQACSGPNINADAQIAAAVSTRIYFSGPVCWKTLRVQYQDKTVDAPIVDECFPCEGIQLTRPALAQLGADAAGSIQVTWAMLDDNPSPGSATQTQASSSSTKETSSPDPSSPVVKTETKSRALAPGAITGIAVAAVAAVAVGALLLFLCRRRRRRSGETLHPAHFSPTREPATPDKPEIIQPTPEPQMGQSESNHSREEVAQLHAAMRRAGFSVQGVIANLRGGAPPAYDEGGNNAGR